MSQNPKSSKLAILLLGILSMTFAEVFSGSSPLWPFSLVSWLIAFPVYWSHILFFLGLAVRYHRFSIPHLYLWGMLFGFYESWVTKVVWGGFMDQTAPPAIQIFGIAIIETIMIIFFWHPLFSFIIPVIVYQMLMQSNNPNAPLLSGHEKLLTPSRRNKALGVVIAIIGGAGIAGGAQQNIAVVLPVTVTSTLLIVIVYKLATRRNRTPSVESVILGTRGLVMVGLFIAAFYAVTFPTWLPERIPSADGMIAVVLFYVVLLLILRASPKVEVVYEASANERLLGYGWFLRVMALFIVAALVMALIPALGFIVFATEVYGMLVVGPLLFIFTLLGLRRLRPSPDVDTQN